MCKTAAVPAAFAFAALAGAFKTPEPYAVQQEADVRPPAASRSPWPSFAGPYTNGTSTRASGAECPPDAVLLGGRQRWSAASGGRLAGGLVVAPSGLVVAASGIRLLGFDPRGGGVDAPVWWAPLGLAVAGTPCVGMAGLTPAIFVTSVNGRIFAVDSGRGNVLWSSVLPGESFLSEASAPVYVESTRTVMVTGGPSSSKLFAVNASTGVVRTLFTAGCPGLTAPLVGSAAADTLVFTSCSSGSVFAVAAKTGASAWSAGAAGVTTPLALGNQGLLLAGTAAGIVALDTATGKQSWTRGVEGGVAMPLCVDADGVAFAASRVNGSDGGLLIAINASDGAGRVIWTVELQYPPTAGPTIGAGGAVLVPVGGGGGTDTVIAVDRTAQGALLWQFRLDGRAEAPVATAGDGTALAGTLTGTVYVEARPPSRSADHAAGAALSFLCTRACGQDARLKHRRRLIDQKNKLGTGSRANAAGATSVRRRRSTRWRRSAAVPFWCLQF